MLKIKEYAIPFERDITIAVAADLHEQDPSDAIAKLSEIKPDLILIPGDLFERLTEDYKREFAKPNGGELHHGIKSHIFHFMFWCMRRLDDFMEGFRLLFPGIKPVQYVKEHSYQFLEKAAKIAPLIYSPGNHEMYLTEEDYKILEETGTIILDNSDCEYQIADIPVQIGGLTGNIDLTWLEEFSKKDGMKILLCHQPDLYVKYIWNTGLDTFDFVVSGHAHGGQWKIFGVPVYAPDQGLFPKYVSGRVGKMIISTGIANTANLPRFGNPCEIVVIKGGIGDGSD